MQHPGTYQLIIALLSCLCLCGYFHGAAAKPSPTPDLRLYVKMDYPMKRNFSIEGLNKQEQDNIIHVHNALRSIVQPYAANMLEAVWDDEIAAMAQEWADECTATHRKIRNLGSYINMGQNLYWWYGGEYNEAMAVDFWWNELEWYNLVNESCVDHEVCGHYITMVWAKSQKIGCGVSRCDRLADLPDYGRGAYYFVCDYSGRFVSDIRPYIPTDTPCSSCESTDFPKCRYNLCVTQEMIDNNIGYNGSTDSVGHYRSHTVSDLRSNGEPVLEPAVNASAYHDWLVKYEEKKHEKMEKRLERQHEKEERKKHHG